MTVYKDLSIQISQGPGGQYLTQILASPAGQSSAQPFVFPFDEHDGSEVLTSLGRYRDARPATQTSKALPIKEVGTKLFNSIFGGGNGTLLSESRGMVAGEGGLRIKLHIDLNNEALANIANLPWELLYDPGKKEYLNLNTATPIVRYLEVSRAESPALLQRPLKILVLLANPAGTSQLDLEKEQAMINEIWATRDHVEVAFVRGISLQALRARLKQDKFQVLHYSGHGSFDSDAGEGTLELEDEEGQLISVSGEDLRNCVRGTDLKFVFLNACRTAISPKGAKLDPFAGVASALVMEGIPAVVAMQFPVTDKAAIVFSGTVYDQLARGVSVDEAVAEGRVSISLEGSVEWATPALFMRTPNGALFQVEGHPDRTSIPISAPTSDPKPNMSKTPANSSIYDTVRSLVKEDKLEKALDLLSEALKDVDEDLYNDVDKHIQTINRVKKQSRRRLISREDEEVKLNEVTYDILEVLLPKLEGD